MLLYSAQTRLTAAMCVCFSLMTLHYFYFQRPSPVSFSIITESVNATSTTNLTTNPTNLTSNLPTNLTTAAPSLLSPSPSSSSRWPIVWIPEKHWQVWRLNIADFEPQEIERMRTWRHQNPFHRYEVFSHESTETFVRGAFADIWPEVVNTFFAVRDSIIRADFLRYLVLWREGGVYSDIDTKALKPIVTWIPEPYKNRVNAVSLCSHLLFLISLDWGQVDVHGRA